jgi:hypothetical protein
VAISTAGRAAGPKAIACADSARLAPSGLFGTPDRDRALYRGRMGTDNGAFVREGIANVHDVFLNASVLRDRMRAALGRSRSAGLVLVPCAAGCSAPRRVLVAEDGMREENGGDGTALIRPLTLARRGLTIIRDLATNGACTGGAERAC